jgi:hypothetical protein
MTTIYSTARVPFIPQFLPFTFWGNIGLLISNLFTGTRLKVSILYCGQRDEYKKLGDHVQCLFKFLVNIFPSSSQVMGKIHVILSDGTVVTDVEVEH